MRISAIGATAVACGVAVGAFATTASSGEGGTSLREQVRLRELLTLQHALGARTDAFDIRPQIIGGEVAPAGKWPFQVALLDATVANNYQAQFCGGSLIGAKHVLTAAHCVKGMQASKLHILTGTQSLQTGGTRRRVASIKVHPQYRSSTSDYDIAVVTLQTAANGITPIAMLAKADETALADPGTLAYVTGWGDIDKGSADNYPTQLHQVLIPLVSRTVCNAPVSYDGEITARMICAGLQQGGKDSCQGDSGGPLIVRDASNKWRVQVGIVSWGEGCARKNFYGVYSRVATLGSWAKSIVNGAGIPAVAEACGGRDEGACLDRAIASVASEARDYLDQINRDGTPAQRRAAEAEQRAWTQSLAGLCAFDAATRGEPGRKACTLRELRHRAATLSEYLTAAGQ